MEVPRNTQTSFISNLPLSPTGKILDQTIRREKGRGFAQAIIHLAPASLLAGLFAADGILTAQWIGPGGKGVIRGGYTVHEMDGFSNLINNHFGASGLAKVDSLEGILTAGVFEMLRHMPNWKIGKFEIPTGTIASTAWLASWGGGELFAVAVNLYSYLGHGPLLHGLPFPI